ncbi:MAG: leucine-rich repeat domain-containing protein, partial [Pseudobutyrivibrio sp.]|nr:leucine-rich repeat domain-containing protein [Pseudobutyrivibrio sp.]
MNKLTRFLSLALALTLTFTSVDMNVFAAELNESSEASIVTTEESNREENTEISSHKDSDDAESSDNQNKSDSNDDNKSNETTNTQEGEANPEEAQEEGEALVEEELEVEEAEEQEMLEAITAEDLQIEGYKVTKYTGNGGAVEIPEGITSIADYAFSNASEITAITLPTTLTSIGYMSFSDCTNLKKIVIPSSTRKIGYKAFRVNNQVDTEVVIESKSLDVDSSVFEGRNLTSVKLPEGMVTLPQLFNDATFTTGYVLEIPASVTTIADYAFLGATGLKTVTFTGENLTTIGEYAFKNSSISEISLPSKVKTIKYDAFRNCVNLTNITLPEGLQTLGYHAFGADNPVAGDTTVVVKSKNFEGNTAVFQGRNLVSVKLPEGMVTLPQLFNDATFTTGYVLEVPASVTTIADYAFLGATGLKTVAFTGDKLTTIGEYAFKNSSITEINLPSKVKTIGYEAFRNCRSLEKVYLGANISDMGYKVFGECELAYFIITGSGKNTYNALIAQGIDKNRIVSTKSITYKLNGGVA